MPYHVASCLLFCSWLGLAAGMEFKDKSYGDKWDWLDFLATILGGLVGQIIQGIALLLMWKGGVI